MRRTFLALLATALMPHAGLAVPVPPTNQLFGFITTNTTLTIASPGPQYSIVGDLVVLPGVTLTIEPGVTLSFATSDTLQGGIYPTLVELTVRGELVADGVLGDSIRFISMSGDAGEWGGIRIEDQGALLLRRASLKHARQALALYGASVKTIEGVSLASCTDGIWGWFASALSIHDVVGSGLDDGIWLDNSTASMWHVQLDGRYNNAGTGLVLGPGVTTTPPDTLDPLPSTISGFLRGVSMKSGSTARNLLVRDCSSGILQDGTGLLVNYCTVVRSAGHGITFSSGAGRVVLNSISALNTGTGVLGGAANYVDSWSNTQGNWSSVSLGQATASFNPFFVDPSTNDYRLQPHSIFKAFSASGGEIGAYGPGPGPPTTTATRTSWGRLKTLYR